MNSPIPSHPLASHFTEHGLAFALKEGGNVLVSSFGLKNVSPTFIARFNTQTFLLVIHVVLPIRAPASQRLAVADFCNRVNDAIEFGNFEVSPVSGVVRFRVATGLASADAAPELVARRLIGTALGLVDQAFPAFEDVISNGLPAELALGVTDNHGAN